MKLFRHTSNLSLTTLKSNGIDFNYRNIENFKNIDSLVDGLEIDKYSFKNISSEITDKVLTENNKLIKEKDISLGAKDIYQKISELSNTDKNLFIKKYKLTSKQKERIKSKIYEYSKIGLSPTISFPYIIDFVIPLIVTKMSALEFSFTLSNYLIDCYNKFDYLNEELRKVNNNSSIFNNYCRHHNFSHGNSKEDFIIDAFVYINDPEIQKFISDSIYYSYMFSNIILEDKLKIGNKIYSKNKIRNSYTHMRCTPLLNNKVLLYDWKNGIKNEMNINWKEEFSDKDLDKVTTKIFKLQLTKEMKNNPNIFKFNFYFTKDREGFLQSLIFTKNCKTFICNLNHRNKESILWDINIISENTIEQIHNKKDIESFFEEIFIFLENKNNDDYSDIISLVLPQFCKVLDYLEGKCNKKELHKYDNILLKYSDIHQKKFHKSETNDSLIECNLARGFDLERRLFYN